MKRAFLSIELDAGDGKELPTAFRIFASGYIETTKGIFNFDDRAAEAVMAAVADWGNDYCIDYDHAMLSFFSADTSESMKAAGWFQPEVRAGELWATKVSWTEKAAAMLRAREVRYVSPTFNCDDDSRITELINVALTNLPATKKQIPLITSRGRGAGDEDTKERLMPKDKDGSMNRLSILLLGALGLPGHADDAAAIAALTPLQGRAREADELEKEKADLVQKLGTITGKASFGESLGVVLSWKESAGHVATLSTRIVELEQKGREVEVLSLVDQGLKDGKIAPAQKEMWLGIGKKDPDTLKGFLATAAKVVPGAGDRSTEPPTKQAAALTEEQRKAAQKLGLDPKAMEAVGQRMGDLAAGVGSRAVPLQQTKPAAA